MVPVENHSSISDKKLDDTRSDEFTAFFRHE